MIIEDFKQTPPLTPQPDSKEQLLSGLMHLKDTLKVVEILILKSKLRGKTKHEGLNI